jgi:hypothetical protein
MSLKNNFDFPKMSEEERTRMLEKVFNEVPKNHFADEEDRFVLEADIMHQTDINDQLNLLIESLMDDEDYDIYYEDLCGTLQGIINLHEMRVNKLWEHFKIIYELDEYSDEAKKKACKSGSCSYNENIDPDTWMKYQR